MTLRFALISALLLSTVAGVAAQRPAEDTSRRGYEIGVGDKIAGRVLGEEEFNFDSVVDDDGRIQIPFAEEGIVAKCKTEKELRAEVAKHLAKFLKNPQLSVNVVERNRPPAMVFGEVVNQQKLMLTRPATLLEVLSFSGGLRLEASGSIKVTRTIVLGCSEPTADNWHLKNTEGVSFPTRTFSFRSLKETNPTIYPGDIIEVEKSVPVYVVGEVNRPGSVPMPEDGLFLMRAIAMASGASREARMKDVRIYRRKDGTEQPDVINLDGDAIKKGLSPDFRLQAFDIVEVGKSKRNVGEVLLDIATGGAKSVAGTLPIRVLY